MLTIFILLLLQLQAVIGIDPIMNITNDIVTINMDEKLTIPISVNITNLKNVNFIVESENKDIATVSSSIVNTSNSDILNVTLNISAIFLGSTKVMLYLKTDRDTYDFKDILVIVIRKERTIDKIFTASVAILVSILYINFGCAIDWELCRKTLKKPIGPAIGCLCQFLYMPLLSYGIGYILFPDHPEQQIGLFFTGISPGGGASNIWTVLLEGNLNLSVTMTTICTILAFGMMPFWCFTLGKRIFDKGEIAVPYSRIMMFAVGLVVPLAVGFIIQKKLPRVCKLMTRIMKPFSVILILFIIIFAIVTNVYLFKLFSWKIIIAGMGLPWLGFICGMLTAMTFKQPVPDIKAIAIETGIQNTGVAIFLLRFTLKPPAADLTTVVPVSSAIMTPIPLTILYIIKMIMNYRKKDSKQPNISGSLENLEVLTKPTTVKSI